MKKFIKIHLLAFFMQGLIITIMGSGLFKLETFNFLDYVAIGFLSIVILSFIGTVKHYISEVKGEE